MATKITNSPSPVVLGAALFFAIATGSSAGVAFSALASYGVPAALAASWRLLCCEFLQILPFLYSLRSAYRQDTKEDEDSQLWLRKEPDWNASEYSKSVSSISFSGRRHTDDDDDEGYGTIKNMNSMDKNKGNKKVITSQISQHNTRFLLSPTTEFFRNYISVLPLMALSGILLSLHFFASVYSIERTSLFHSLLFVSMSPIILNGGQWMLVFLQTLGIFCKFGEMPLISRPSKMETIGVLIGISGAAFMLLDIGSISSSSSSSSSSSASTNIRQPTFEGDIAAFLGSLAISFHLLIGRKLRPWIPVWLYTFPVYSFAIMTSIVLAFLDSETPATTTTITWKEGDPRFAIFGFLDSKFFWLSLYLGACPGICGHTLIAALIKYLSPLTISTALLAEPLLGAILGYFFGMQDLPHLGTCIGAIILLLGLLLIVAGESGCQSLMDIWDGNIGFLAKANDVGGCRCSSCDVRIGEDVNESLSYKGSSNSCGSTTTKKNENGETMHLIV